jgi:hypothetical protein
MIFYFILKINIISMGYIVLNEWSYGDFWCTGR